MAASIFKSFAFALATLAATAVLVVAGLTEPPQGLPMSGATVGQSDR